MKRRAALLATLILALPAPAWADNEDENRNGDCRETKKGAHCEDNDLSPSFQDSPVDRSFNPVICLPGSTCNFDGSGQGR